MSNSEVKIKDVDGQAIMLEECEVGEFRAVRLLAINMICIGLAALLYALIGTTPTIATEPAILRPVTIIVVGIICPFILMWGVGIQNAGVPGFSVRVLGETSSKIYIKKTTPEQDQKEVCRAVQELEQRAREISKKERELIRIAQGCK